VGDRATVLRVGKIARARSPARIRMRMRFCPRYAVCPAAQLDGVTDRAGT